MNTLPGLSLQYDRADLALSWGLFMCRLFTGAALVYMALGCLLYWREFLVNASALNLPYVVPGAFGLIGAELLIGLFLLLGWYTRFFASVALLVSVICAVIFFLGQINHLFVAWCLLLAAPLSILILLGSGNISLDYKRRVRQAQKMLRG